MLRYSERNCPAGSPIAYSTRGEATQTVAPERTAPKPASAPPVGWPTVTFGHSSTRAGNLSTRQLRPPSELATSSPPGEGDARERAADRLGHCPPASAGAAHEQLVLRDSGDAVRAVEVEGAHGQAVVPLAAPGPSAVSARGDPGQAGHVPGAGIGKLDEVVGRLRPRLGVYRPGGSPRQATVGRPQHERPGGRRWADGVGVGARGAPGGDKAEPATLPAWRVGRSEPHRPEGGEVEAIGAKAPRRTGIGAPPQAVAGGNDKVLPVERLERGGPAELPSVKDASDLKGATRPAALDDDLAMVGADSKDGRSRARDSGDPGLGNASPPTVRWRSEVHRSPLPTGVVARPQPGSLGGAGPG
jgi:hypothetical protein